MSYFQKLHHPNILKITVRGEKKFFAIFYDIVILIEFYTLNVQAFILLLLFIV